MKLKIKDGEARLLALENSIGLKSIQALNVFTDITEEDI